MKHFKSSVCTILAYYLNIFGHQWTRTTFALADLSPDLESALHDEVPEPLRLGSTPAVFTGLVTAPQTPCNNL